MKEEDDEEGEEAEEIENKGEKKGKVRVLICFSMLAIDVTLI
jgi:hypothetical protein